MAKEFCLFLSCLSFVLGCLVHCAQCTVEDILKNIELPQFESHDYLQGDNDNSAKTQQMSGKTV